MPFAALFTRSVDNPGRGPLLPRPPLDPPRSIEKRHEKEKAWLASVRRHGKSSNNSGASASQQLLLPGEDPRKVDGHLLRLLETPGRCPSGRVAPAHRGKRHSRGNTADSELSRITGSSEGLWDGFASALSLRAGKATSTTGEHERGGETIYPGCSQNRKSTHLAISSYFPLDSSHCPLPPLASPSLSLQRSGPILTRPRTEKDPEQSLAERLAALSSAHAQGLLDDDEYRLLRSDVFQASVGPSSTNPTSTAGHCRAKSTQLGDDGAGVRKEGTRTGEGRGETTGSLLGLPRLVVGVGDSRVNGHAVDTPPCSQQGNPARSAGEAQLDKQDHDLLLPSPLTPNSSSSASTHSRSRLSIRSSRSALSSTLSALVRRRPSERKGSNQPDVGVQTSSTTELRAAAVEADAHERDRASVRAVGRNLRRWKSVRASSELAVQEQEQGGGKEIPRAWRGDKVIKTACDADTRPRAGHLPGGTSQEKTTPAEGRHRSGTLLSMTPSRLSDTRSLHQGVRFSVAQPSDDELDAAGLREAIAAAQKEKEGLDKQFGEMERELVERLGLAGRREKKSAGQTGERKMPSTGTREEVLSLLGSDGAGGLAVSGEALSRRPSLVGSITSMASSSRTTGSREPLYLLTPALGVQRSLSRRHRPPSSILHELDEPGLVRPLGLGGGLESGIHRLVTASSWSTSSGSMYGESASTGTLLDEHASREINEEGGRLCELQKKRENVVRRYDERIEYLEAKLRARELKDKLRR